jgi:hypothetical protein
MLSRDNGTLVYTQTKEKKSDMAESRLPEEKNDRKRERKYKKETTKEEPGFQNPTPTSHTQDRYLPTRGIASIYIQDLVRVNASAEQFGGHFDPQSAFTAAQSQHLHIPGT